MMMMMKAFFRSGECTTKPTIGFVIIVEGNPKGVDGSHIPCVFRREAVFDSNGKQSAGYRSESDFLGACIHAWMRSCVRRQEGVLVTPLVEGGKSILSCGTFCDLRHQKHVVMGVRRRK